MDGWLGLLVFFAGSAAIAGVLYLILSLVTGRSEPREHLGQDGFDGENDSDADDDGPDDDDDLASRGTIARSAETKPTDPAAIPDALKSTAPAWEEPEPVMRSEDKPD